MHGSHGMRLLHLCFLYRCISDVVLLWLDATMPLYTLCKYARPPNAACVSLMAAHHWTRLHRSRPLRRPLHFAPLRTCSRIFTDTIRPTAFGGWQWVRVEGLGEGGSGFGSNMAWQRQRPGASSGSTWFETSSTKAQHLCRLKERTSRMLETSVCCFFCFPRLCIQTEW